jgi:type I restriction enzyme R subunit
LLESLAEKGFGGEQLREIERMIDAEKSDLYDVLAYIAFALSPITRQERADARKVNIFSHYDAKLQAFLAFVLSQYVKEGVGELDQAKLPHLLELKYRAASRLSCTPSFPGQPFRHSLLFRASLCIKPKQLT